MSVDVSPIPTQWPCEPVAVPIVLPHEEIATPSPAPSDASQPASRFGTVYGVKRFAYRVGRRLLKLGIADVLSVDLAELHRRAQRPSRLDFRFLSVGDIRRAASDPENDLDLAMADRVRTGCNFCFAAFDRGRLANYSWYAVHHIEPEHCFGSGLALPRDTVYLYKAFTAPAYRGRRLHEATLYRATQIFAETGIRRLVALVEYGDWPSLRSHQRLGCRAIGRLWRVGGVVIARPCNDGFSGLQFGV